MQSTSPAINAGTSILAASTDADGNSRPSGSAFDMGAYEYGATSAATLTNMLINPGFESAVTIGWTGDWGNTSIITTNKNSGNNALKVGPSAGGRAQTLTSGFTVGNQYTLSAYCMLSGSGTAGSGYIGLVCINAAGAKTILKSTDITNTGSFVKKIATFSIPSGTTSIEVHVWYNGGIASVYIDDFSFVSGSTAGSGNIQPVIILPETYVADKISIYPNPVYTKSFTLSIPKYAGKKNICVYDMSGKLLLNQNLTDATTQVIKLNKSILPGNYVVKITGNVKSHEQIIIVK